MRRFFRRLKISKAQSDGEEGGEDTGSDTDSYRSWWETDSFLAELSADKTRSKAVARCRQRLQAQLKSEGARFVHPLLQDIGGAGGKSVTELELQNLAIIEAEVAANLGHFERAHVFLECLERGEHVPATHFYRAQIYLSQGYRNRANKELQLALELLSTPGSEHQHGRFHDLVKAILAFANVEDWQSSPSSEYTPEACEDLATHIWDRWICNLPIPKYDLIYVRSFVSLRSLVSFRTG